MTKGAVKRIIKAEKQKPENARDSGFVRRVAGAADKNKAKSS